MNNLSKIIAALAALVVLVVVGVGVYVYVSGGSGEASEPITAPTLEPRPATEEAAMTEESAMEEAAATEETVTEEAAAEEATATEEVATSDLLFRIDPEQSEVRFILEEDLRGVRTTVVGTTNQVAGDILIDRANPANSVIGTIRINVRTLATDNDFRNRAIRGQILESARDEYEFSEFVPTGISGMPASVNVGDTFSFSITGDLTVRNITQAVTFNAEVTASTEDRIEGKASAVVLRSDYDLQIPNVPSVANVTNEVTLEIDFVASLVQ